MRKNCWGSIFCHDIVAHMQWVAGRLWASITRDHILSIKSAKRSPLQALLIPTFKFQVQHKIAEMYHLLLRRKCRYFFKITEVTLNGQKCDNYSIHMIAL